MAWSSSSALPHQLRPLSSAISVHVSVLACHQPQLILMIYTALMTLFLGYIMLRHISGFMVKFFSVASPGSLAILIGLFERSHRKKVKRSIIVWKSTIALPNCEFKKERCACMVPLWGILKYMQLCPLKHCDVIMFCPNSQWLAWRNCATHEDHFSPSGWDYAGV